MNSKILFWVSLLIAGSGICSAVAVGTGAAGLAWLAAALWLWAGHRAAVLASQHSRDLFVANLYILEIEYPEHFKQLGIPSVRNQIKLEVRKLETEASGDENK